MSLVFGFGGVRDFRGELSIAPHLPQRWRSLSFPIRFRDRQLRITLTHDKELYLLEDGEPLDVAVHGVSRTLVAGVPLELAAGGGGSET